MRWIGACSVAVAAMLGSELLASEARASAQLAIVTSAPVPPPALAEPPSCRAGLPDDLVGEWEIDGRRTRNAYLASNPEHERPVLVPTGRLTFHEDVVVQPESFLDSERRYRVIGGNARQYLLELEDPAGNTTVLKVDLVPCGLVLQGTDPGCEEAFCRHAREEAIRAMEAQAPPGLDVREHVRANERMKETIAVPQRIFYRPLEAATDGSARLLGQAGGH